jgi:hypothetical protein
MKIVTRRRPTMEEKEDEEGEPKCKEGLYTSSSRPSDKRATSSPELGHGTALWCATCHTWPCRSDLAVPMKCERLRITIRTLRCESRYSVGCVCRGPGAGEGLSGACHCAVSTKVSLLANDDSNGRPILR